MTSLISFIPPVSSLGNAQNEHFNMLVTYLTQNQLVESTKKDSRQVTDRIKGYLRLDDVGVHWLARLRCKRSQLNLFRKT